MTTRFALISALSILSLTPARAEDLMLDELIFYASFDDHLAADVAGNRGTIRTRADHPERKGEFVVTDGFDEKTFRIAKKQGVRGGALEAVDVLPRRGRIFFPAKGNLPYKTGGWGGTVSFWLNTNPDTLLKTPFCDPVQITQRGANDGGLWIDFPDSKPRAMRLGAFPAVKPGGRAFSESDADAPMVRVEKIGFEQGQWHHVAFAWKNFDTGKADAEAVLFVDGRRQGALENREIAMDWDLEKTGIYVAVNYIGLLDEFAIFRRSLSADEIGKLHSDPGLAAGLKK